MNTPRMISLDQPLRAPTKGPPISRGKELPQLLIAGPMMPPIGVSTETRLRMGGVRLLASRFSHLCLWLLNSQRPQAAPPGGSGQFLPTLRHASGPGKLQPSPSPPGQLQRVVGQPAYILPLHCLLSYSVCCRRSACPGSDSSSLLTRPSRFRMRLTTTSATTTTAPGTARRSMMFSATIASSLKLRPVICHPFGCRRSATVGSLALAFA